MIKQSYLTVFLGRASHYNNNYDDDDDVVEHY